MNAPAYPDALPKGYELHWYVLEDVLGQGGFGITYLARDSNLDRTVAIKEYLPVETATRLPDATVSPRTRSQSERYTAGLDGFLREARTLARFRHANIVRVHSVFQHNNTAYMVMDYEAGETLATLLERRHTLKESELLQVLLPVMDGLTLVHEAGFIHRDIKPENILLRPDGSPVLLDFGSARAAMGRSGTMTILVAPGYAPYEQYYASAESQGPWTDIYGLGATCYRAIAGKPPLDAIARSKGVLGSTREMLEPASVVAAGRYTERFLRAIDHALAFAEKDRPQSLQAWRLELVASDVPGAAAVFGPAQTNAPSSRPSPAAGPPGLAAPVPLGRRELVAWVLAAAGVGAAVAALVMLSVLPAGSARDPHSVATESVSSNAASSGAQPNLLPDVTRPLQPSTPAIASAPSAAPAPVLASAPPDPVAQPATPHPAAAPERTVARKTDRPAAPARARPVPAAPVPTPRPAIDPAPAHAAIPADEVPPRAARTEAALVPSQPPQAAPPVPLAASATVTAEPPGRVAAARPRPEALRPPADAREAFSYYRRLALDGHAEAQFKLGELYATGRGVGQSLNQAYLWYGMAAKAGHTQAQARQAQISANLQPAEVRQVDRYLQRNAPAASEAAR